MRSIGQHGLKPAIFRAAETRSSSTQYFAPICN